MDLVDSKKDVPEGANVIDGRIEVAMYIGAIIRYTIRSGEQVIYVDAGDPEHSGIYQEGSLVKLILKKEIHMFKVPSS